MALTHLVPGSWKSTRPLTWYHVPRYLTGSRSGLVAGLGQAANEELTRRDRETRVKAIILIKV